MWEYNYNYSDELYHYGVKGMKWGHKKARYDAVSTDGSKRRAYESAKRTLDKARDDKRAANRAYSKAFKKSTSVYGAYGPGNKQRHERTYDAAIAANKADKQYKNAKKAAKIAKKAAKIEAKAVKTKYREQYMKGESTVGKILSRLTDADKHYANIAYETNKGAYREKW